MCTLLIFGSIQLINPSNANTIKPKSHCIVFICFLFHIVFFLYNIFFKNKNLFNLQIEFIIGFAVFFFIFFSFQLNFTVKIFLLEKSYFSVFSVFFSSFILLFHRFVYGSVLFFFFFQYIVVFREKFFFF